MEKDGLVLLLSFAAGALRDKVCGSGFFAEKVFAFLGGHWELESEIREDVPTQLKNAWRFLEMIGGEFGLGPLDEQCVSAYILGKEEILHLSHNKLVENGCRVLSGIIQKFLAQRKILVKCRGGFGRDVWYIGKTGEALEVGDLIAFHRGYLVAKITAKQEKFL